MNETSLSLLACLRNSSESEAWARFVNLYAPLLESWLLKYDVPAADVDDLVQEVLAVVSQELPNFGHNQRVGAFRCWLRKVLVYRLQNYWRSRKQHPPAQGGSFVLEQLNQLQDDASGLSRIWDEQHDRDVIARLLEIVQPRFQQKTWEAFRRQILDGQKPAQVAAELGMSLGSVYMARNRVLAVLRSEAEGLVETL